MPATTAPSETAPNPNINGGASHSAALGLLGAFPFVLSLSTDGDHFVWPDKAGLCAFLRAPENRIPTSVEDFHSLLTPSSRELRQSALRDLLWDGDQYKITYPIRAFDGELRWAEERGQRLSGNQDQALQVSGVITNVTDAKQAALHTARQTSRDPLTGLWNRARFIEALEYELSLAHVKKQPGYAVCLALNNFDEIKAALGGDAAEASIQAAAAYLKSSLSLPYKAARLSSASFGVLLPGLTQQDAEYKTTQCLAAFIEIDTPGTMPSTFSVSGLPLTPMQTTPSDMLSLLESQVRPTNEAWAFMEQTRTTKPAVVDAYTSDKILSLLSERKITVAYQPIIYARSREVHHYECLLRVKTDTGDLVSAAPMIIAAEKLGCVHLLDQRALEIAILTLRQNPDIHLALNVSPGTIGNEFAAQNYLSTLKSLGGDVRRITIELTETLPLDDINKAAVFSENIKAMNGRFAIDDFGSGHTTFQNLMALNADIIKIDGSMVKDLSGSAHKQAFMRMMVDLARTFGVETVAEMVSSEADAALMERLGVTYFQGFIFGMPNASPLMQSKSA